MKVLSDTGDQADSRDTFRIIIEVDDDIQTEKTQKTASTFASSSSDNQFILPEGDGEPQKQIQESISSILQLFSNCKFTTGDIFLKGKLREINILDGYFYFDTLQSLKHTKQLIAHAEKVIQFIDSIKVQITDVSEVLHLMAISKELIKDSKKKKEIIDELIKNYDYNLKSIRNILEGIKTHKESISKAKDLLPVNVTEIKRIQTEFEKWDREAKVYFSYVKGFFVCFSILVFFEMMDLLGSFYLNTHHAIMIIVYGILLLVGVIIYLYASNYRSKADDYLWEYWKKHKDYLEELTIVNSYGQENMSEKWTRNMKSYEDYNRLVGDILDRKEGENRKMYF
ncbi:15173_t:CDS:2 [Acaulospora morrowiae]|uniref:15173_t:CDS:1 n=1 Tax=Acaulospora morrowiae TaxID=94023 RepID=A0A9N9AK70_9GLOM|nr:15173_t:CDS:2 [Acaulospora morrowiae]